MMKLLMVAAAGGLALTFASPAAADASPRKAAGASQSQAIEFSAKRRRASSRYRYSQGYARPYYRYRYGSPYYAYPRASVPYYAYSYGYAPYYAYQPYAYVGPYGW